MVTTFVSASWLSYHMLDLTHDRNISKQVKEAKEKYEGRDLLEQKKP